MTRRDIATWVWLGRQLWSWGEKLLMLIVSLVIGIAWITIGKARPGSGLGPDESRGSGLVIRVEVIDIWLPVTLIDLARQPPACRKVTRNYDPCSNAMDGKTSGLH